MGFLDNVGQNAAAVGQSGAAGPWGMLAGSILGGLFSKKPQLTPEQQQIFDFQTGIANQLKQYAGSVPLSDPQEQANLAQQRGLLGQEQNMERGQLGSALSMDPSGGFQNGGDFMRNLTLQQGGQRIALDQTQLMAALQRRRDALQQASGAESQAFGPASSQRQGGYNFASLFGNIAQQSAFNKARNAGGGDGGGGSFASGESAPGAPGLPGLEGGIQFRDWSGSGNNVEGRTTYQPSGNTTFQAPQNQMPSLYGV